MNQSQKLNLFVGLGCKAMKDVILHHPLWVLHCKNKTITYTEWMEQVRTALEFETEKTLPEMVMRFEAFPERLTPIEISTNLLNLFNDYGEIEAVKDIEPMIT